MLCCLGVYGLALDPVAATCRSQTLIFQWPRECIDNHNGANVGQTSSTYPIDGGSNKNDQRATLARVNVDGTVNPLRMLDPPLTLVCSRVNRGDQLFLRPQIRLLPMLPRFEKLVLNIANDLSGDEGKRYRVPSWAGALAVPCSLPSL